MPGTFDGSHAWDSFLRATLIPELAYEGSVQRAAFEALFKQIGYPLHVHRINVPNGANWQVHRVPGMDNPPRTQKFIGAAEPHHIILWSSEHGVRWAAAPHDFTPTPSMRDPGVLFNFHEPLFTPANLDRDTTMARLTNYGGAKISLDPATEDYLSDALLDSLGYEYHRDGHWLQCRNFHSALCTESRQGEDCDHFAVGHMGAFFSGGVHQHSVGHFDWTPLKVGDRALWIESNTVPGTGGGKDAEIAYFMKGSDPWNLGPKQPQDNFNIFLFCIYIDSVLLDVWNSATGFENPIELVFVFYQTGNVDLVSPGGGSWRAGSDVFRRGFGSTQQNGNEYDDGGTTRQTVAARLKWDVFPSAGAPAWADPRNEFSVGWNTRAVRKRDFQVLVNNKGASLSSLISDPAFLPGENAEHFDWSSVCGFQAFLRPSGTTGEISNRIAKAALAPLYFGPPLGIQRELRPMEISTDRQPDVADAETPSNTLLFWNDTGKDAEVLIAYVGQNPPVA